MELVPRAEEDTLFLRVCYTEQLFDHLVYFRLFFCFLFVAFYIKRL